MDTKPLHIISFDNPFPPNYGGVIDVFYKVKSLYELGFTIYLHCFYDDRGSVSEELKAITQKVYLYKKNRNPLFLFSAIPFGVKSRFNKELLNNIRAVEAPVLFEGLQSTMLIQKGELRGKKFLRLHNLESQFYAGMYRSETHWFKKMMYYFEKGKYENYETQLHHFNRVFTLSVHETQVVRSWSDRVTYIPVFHGNTTVENRSEFGEFALYHGDLRLPDNKKAVTFLTKVFKQIPDYNLLIASSNGKDFVNQQINGLKNIQFVSIEKEETLQDLLEKAHINVLVSFQQSGTKLKLINSLFKSRFCLINDNMVDDENILQLCERATSTEAFISKIKELKNRPYTANEERKRLLSSILNAGENANKMAMYFTKT